MKSNFTINFPLLALALSHILVFTSIAEARPTVGGGTASPPVINPTTRPSTIPTNIPKPKPNSSVQCENLMTVARQGNNAAVLIAWNTAEFGPEYTPANRCNIVSNKLNALIQSNGGKFSNLRLTNGPVNGRIVICALKPGEVECNGSNQLFTLKRENERVAGRILGQLLNIGVAGSGTINEDSGEQVIVDLGEWAELRLQASPSTDEQPQNPENIEPFVNPETPSSGGFE
ncbi:MAG: hypothetical protein RLZZ507_803 [Cyanobacteriota bacterium]|jgi:hypothetical protein